MNAFETNLNDLLVNTFNYILKFEESSLKMVAEVPVTVTEVHMIESISKRSGKSSVSDIATDLNIAVPTATVAVKKLIGKGLVEKAPSSDDGRRFIISLTKHGEKVDKAHEIFHRRMVRNISHEFTDDEKELLLSAIQKLSLFFKEKIED